MHDDYILWTNLFSKMSDSKQDFLNYLEWLCGKDSDEYKLVNSYFQENDLNKFFDEYYEGDPDEMINYILDFIEEEIRGEVGEMNDT